MYPFFSLGNPLVSADLDRFCRLIKTKGGQLGDGVISDREAFTRLWLFVTKLYAIVGRQCDFWPLQEAYQLGFGSKVYSFHGREGTLVNGPTWGINGLSFSGTSHITTTLGNDYNDYSCIFFANRTSAVGYQRLVASPDSLHTDLFASDGGEGIGVYRNASVVALPKKSTLGWHSLAISKQNTTVRTLIDDVSASYTFTDSGSNLTNVLIGSKGLSDAPSWHGSIAGFILTRSLGLDRMSMVIDAFKSTIGKELGLA